VITEIGLVITGRPLRKSVKTNGERLGATPNPIVEVRLITATDLGDHPGPIRVIIPTEMRSVGDRGRALALAAVLSDVPENVPATG
jgi:hypothetical protein